MYRIALVLPAPAKGSAAEKIVEKFKKYEVPYSVGKWYEPRELTSLFITLRGKMDQVMAKDLMGVKKERGLKGEEREMKMHNIEKGYEEEFKEVVRAIPGYAKSFGERLEDLKKQTLDPRQYEEYAKNLDPSEFTVELQDRWKKTMEKAVEKAAPKERGQTTVKRVKFDALGHEMRQTLNDISKLGGKLKSADIPKVDAAGSKSAEERRSAERLAAEGAGIFVKKPSGWEFIQYAESTVIFEEMTAKAQDTNAIIKAYQAELEDAWDKVKDKAEGGEIKKTLDEARKVPQFPVTVEVGKMSRYYPSYLADIIVRYATLFRRMYSMYHGSYWAHEKQEVKPLEEQHKEKIEIRTAEVSVENLQHQYGALNEKRDSALGSVRRFTALSPLSEESYKASDQAIKALKEFSEDSDTYHKAFAEYMKAGEKKGSFMLPYEPIFKFSADKVDPKTLFPVENLKMLAGQFQDKDLRGLAEGDIDKVYNHLVGKYHNPSPALLVKVEETGLSYENFMKEWWKALSKALSMRFKEVLKDDKELNKPEPDESEKQIKRYPKLHQVMKTYQEHGLLHELPLTKEKKVPETLINTDAVNEYLDKHFLIDNPKDLARQYDKIFKGMGGKPTFDSGSGGGGGTGGGREKPKKAPIPEVTQEIVNDRFIKKYLRGQESPKAFVKDLVDNLVHNIRIHGERGGESPHVGAAIAGMVKMLEMIPMTIGMVSVNVPEAARRPDKFPLYPKDAPRYLERPTGADIVIDSKKECLDMLHKLEALYDAIDALLEPKKISRKFPKGFGEASEVFQVKLPEPIKVAGQMIYEVASRFAGMEISKIPELEILSR